MTNQSAHRRTALIIFTLCACAAVSLPANEIQRHILDTGINLGWAEAVLESQGITPDNVAYLRGCMTRASAHIEAVKSLLPAPYAASIDLAPLQADILAWETKTGGQGSVAQASYVANLLGRFVQTLSVWLDARTNSLVGGGNCDTAFALAGYHFGRASIASNFGEEANLRYRLADLRAAISTGLAQNERKKCGFATSPEWEALTIFTTATTPVSFNTSREQIQALALAATGSPAGVSDPGAAGSAVTATMALWNGRWRNFGDVGLGPMTLHVKGNRITGEIFAGRPEKQVGVIEATFVDEKTVTGTWTLWNPTRGGIFEWTLTNMDPQRTGFQGWQIRRNNYPVEIHNHKYHWVGTRDQTVAGQ